MVASVMRWIRLRLSNPKTVEGIANSLQPSREMHREPETSAMAWSTSCGVRLP